MEQPTRFTMQIQYKSGRIEEYRGDLNKGGKLPKKYGKIRDDAKAFPTVERVTVEAY